MILLDEQYACLVIELAQFSLQKYYIQYDEVVQTIGIKRIIESEKLGGGNVSRLF